MPIQLCILKAQLLSKQKNKGGGAGGIHKEHWLVEHWPEYVERTFEKSPDDMVHQLRKMVKEKATPEVIAHKVRGQTVKPIDSRPLGDLQFAKLEELLLIYEEKLQAWWEAKNAGQLLTKNLLAQGFSSSLLCCLF